MNILHLFHIGIGAFVSLIAIPLILRMVPMNRYYGVRIPKAFTSDANWYELNAYGGWLLLIYGVCLFAFGVFAGRRAPDSRSIASLPFVLVPLLLILPVLGLIVARARRLP